MNVLDMALTYLAGPIDDADDHGKGWRQYMIKKMIERKINLVILDPTTKISSLISESEDQKRMHQSLKREHKWDELSSYMKTIVREDLRQIDFCDFLIVKIDTNCHMCGTYSEIQIADLQHKPILAIIEGGKEYAPSWLFGILDHQFMFNNEDECVEYLDNVNKGLIAVDSKWVLIRKKIRGILFESREKEFKKIEDNLLKTKDGVVIMPGMRIFWNSNDIKSSTLGYEVFTVTVWKKENPDDFNGKVEVKIENNERTFYAPDDFGLYSSTEALKSQKL